MRIPSSAIRTVVLLLAAGAYCLGNPIPPPINEEPSQAARQQQQETAPVTPLLTPSAPSLAPADPGSSDSILNPSPSVPPFESSLPPSPFAPAPMDNSLPSDSPVPTPPDPSSDNGGGDSKPANVPQTPFLIALRNACVAYDHTDFTAALRFLDEADTLQPRDLNVYTLRATCYLKKKQYDDAREWYQKAIEIDPSASAPRFNLAETFFLQKQYAKARIRFDALLAQDPTNEVIRFKIYLCVLTSHQLREADAMRKRFDIMGKTPAYHYARAAWSFTQGDEIDARDWIHKAQEVYQPRDFIIFEDALINLGLLPNPFAPKAPSGGSPSPQASSAR